jgi:DNA (cytosine-5)-methyltransferase 1
VAVAFGGNNTAGAIDVATARVACSSPHGRLDFESETFLVQPTAFCAHVEVMPTIRAGGNRTGGDRPPGTDVDTAETLLTVLEPFAFDTQQITSAANRTRVSPELPASTLSKESRMHVASALQVRRLTPTECERLQGFPDGWTQVPYRGTPASDGPRYKALGNSMAVPVMAWIGRRIAEVNTIISLKEAA